MNESDSKLDTVPPALSRDRLAVGPVGAVVAVSLALHLYVLATTRFGVHRDEFLYLSMGRHLRLWRMDFPPAIAILARIASALFGDSLGSVRVLPALAHATVIAAAALVARELGGQRFAQTLAAVAVLCGVLFLRAGTLFQPVIFDQLWWTLGLLALARVVREGPRQWIGYGVATGLGLLTKFSVLFFGLATLVAVVVTPQRRSLASRWPWLAAAIAVTIGSAAIVGQFTLGFPVLTQMRELQGSQLARVTWSEFVGTQPLMVGPVAFALALGGLLALLFSRPLRAFGVLGWTCLTAFVILMVLHGKAYYIGPIYPALFAAGAVALEQMRAPRWATALRWVTTGGIALFGLVALPIALPLLSPEGTAVYASKLGIAPALRTNRGEMDRLPQDFADMLGWEEQARAIAAVYHSLPPDEQRAAVIAGGNYGRAGAAEFYGARYALPSVVSSAGSFWYFGPGERPGRVLIMIGGDPADLAPIYGEVREVARIRSPWSVGEERDVPVYVARGQRRTLQQLWPSLAGRN